MAYQEKYGKTVINTDFNERRCRQIADVDCARITKIVATEHFLGSLHFRWLHLALKIAFYADQNAVINNSGLGTLVAVYKSLFVFCVLVSV